MKRKMRKFADGGDTVSDFAEDANTRIQAAANEGRPAKSEMYQAEPASEVGPTISDKEAFRRKFAAERAKGNKTFEWKGKTVTTELASDKKKPTAEKPAAEKPAAEKPATEKATPSSEPVKSAAKSSSGFGPKNTFLTEDRLNKSKEAMKSGWSNPFSGISKVIAEGHKTEKDYNRQLADRSGMKKGGAVKKMASGGSTSSASKRGDGIATKGKTRGKLY